MPFSTALFPSRSFQSSEVGSWWHVFGIYSGASSARGLILTVWNLLCFVSLFLSLFAFFFSLFVSFFFFAFVSIFCVGLFSQPYS